MRSRRQHKAWGGAKRNPSGTQAGVIQPAERAAESSTSKPSKRHRFSLLPLRGLRDLPAQIMGLRPRLYAFACSEVCMRDFNREFRSSKQERGIF